MNINKLHSNTFYNIKNRKNYNNVNFEKGQKDPCVFLLLTVITNHICMVYLQSIRPSLLLFLLLQGSNNILINLILFFVYFNLSI